MSLISENVYIDKLADKYKNAYHKIIKMKPANVKSSTYIDFGEENNEKDPKFEVGDQVRRPKYRKHFSERLHSILNWRSEHCE